MIKKIDKEYVKRTIGINSKSKRNKRIKMGQMENVCSAFGDFPAITVDFFCAAAGVIWV